jgi:hypothetical protein
MSAVGFEQTIPVFDRTITVISIPSIPLDKELVKE